MDFTSPYFQGFSMIGKPLHLLATLLILTLVNLPGCDRQTPESLIARAEQAMANRQYQSAVIDLKTVLREDRNNLRARWLLGEVYLAVEDGPSAEKELSKAGELGVTDNALLPAMAQALYLQRRFDDLLALQGGAVLTPKLAGEFAALKVLAHLELGQLEQAKVALVTALSKAPTSVRVRYAEARILIADGDIDLALEKVYAINEEQPDYADAWTLRGKLLADKKEFAAAEDAYTKAIALRTYAFEDRFNRGFARFAQEKFEEALQDAMALQAAAPKFYPGHYLAGLIHYQSGRLEQAQEALAQALELAPRDFATVFLLAAVEAKLGDSIRGRQLAEQAVAMVPNHIAARKLLALWYLRDRKGLEAERMVRPIVQALPDDLQAKNLLATALMTQGNVKEASAIFEELAAAQPESPKAQLRAGLSAMSAGDSKKGLDTLGRAVAIAPEDQDINAALIGGFLRQQSSSEALAAARRFVERKPDDPAALNLLAATQAATADRAAAKRTYKAVLEKDPGNLAATRALALLALSDKDYEGAKNYLDKGLAKNPDNLQLLLLEARVAGAGADLVSMDAALERAINAHPEEPEPRALRAQRYLDENAVEKALMVLSGLSEEGHSSVLATRAEAYYRLNRLSDAKVDLEALARQMPNAVDVQWHLARVYAALGEKSNLARALDRLLELKPDDPRASLAKARLLVLEGQVDAAARILDDGGLPADNPDVLLTRVALARQAKDAVAEISYSKALLEAQPSAAHALGLSDAYRRAGRVQDEGDVLTRWLSTHADDVTVRLTLANIRARSGDLSAAIAELRQVIERDPGNHFALNNLAWYLREKSPAEALQFARRAYKEAPGSLEVMDTYALVLAENNDFDTALRIVGEAIGRTEQLAPFMLSRAKIRQMAGQRDAALADVQSILAGNPPDAIRRKAEALLGELAD